MNNSKILRDCLESIYKNYPRLYTFYIVIIDNCSKDNTDNIVKYYSKLLPIKYINNKKSLNFAQNNNICIKRSKSRYYLILNPDTKILPGTLDYMIDFMDRNRKIGASSCKLLYNDLSFQENCRKFPLIKYVIASRFRSWGLPLLKNKSNDYILCDSDDVRPKPVDYIIGACMFLRRETIDDVGMFDERFILYAEDTDLCYRIWKNNWEVWYVPDVSIIHLYDRGSTKTFINKKALLQLYTFILFYMKHYLKIIH